MSIVMAAEAPRSGPIARALNRLFGPRKSSHELEAVSAATARLEAAAGKIEAAAGIISAAVDPIGELVDGLRQGPEERQRKRKAAARRKKTARTK